MTEGPTIFDSVTESSVVFCLDVTGSMRAKLPAVIAELSQFLQLRALDVGLGSLSRFNLVRFGYGVANDSSGVELWSDGLADCTRDAVADALRWLGGHGGPSAAGCRGSSADTRRALAAALAIAVKTGATDSASSVCLVTDSLPDHPPPLPHRPTRLHCVYPKDADLPAQPGLVRELHRLSAGSGGSLTVVNVGRRGRVERVTPVARVVEPSSAVSRWRPADGGVDGVWSDPRVGPSGKLCSVTAALRCDPLMDIPPQPPTLWSRLRTEQDPWASVPWSKLRVSGLPGPPEPPPPPPPMASVALLGRRVLGRRSTDGKFYEGDVIKEDKVKSGHFNVELHIGNLDGFSTVEFQITPVGELISLDDALLRPILPGDCVLAPRGNGRPDYGPAVVLDGHERRHRDERENQRAERSDEFRPLVMAFTDGASCVLTEPQRAVRITHDLYHRLELESTMPRRQRIDLADSAADYPEVSLPGYPTTRPERDPADYEAVRPVWLPGRFLPEASFTHGSQLANYRDDFDGGEDIAGYNSDVDRRAEQLIAEFDNRYIDVGVSTSKGGHSLKRASVVRFRMPSSKSMSGLSRTKPPPQPSRPRFSIPTKSAPVGHVDRHQDRSSNLYDRRPPEIGARLGASRDVLELEARHRRVEENRRSASAERAAALAVRRAVADVVVESKLSHRRDVELGRRQQNVANAETALAAASRPGRRGISPDPPASPRASRKRLLSAAPHEPPVDRPSRLRYLEAPAKVTGSGGGGGGKGKGDLLNRSAVSFGGSEPTIAAWIRNQDHMNAAEARVSAIRLAERHKDCVANKERLRLAAH